MSIESSGGGDSFSGPFDPTEYGDRHELLLTNTGDLKAAARGIAAIREHIEEMPETSLTFTPADIGDGHQYTITPAMAEFAGAWAYSTESKPYRYVNPSNPDASLYGDVSVACACGAELSTAYNLDGVDHTDCCMPYHRLRARARLSEGRHHMLRRLRLFGWSMREVANRFGLRKTRVGEMVQEFCIDWSGLFETYKERSMNTYDHLVYDRDESSEEVAAILGHERTTFERWLGNYD